jgi:hypothetical protein
MSPIVVLSLTWLALTASAGEEEEATGVEVGVGVAVAEVEVFVVEVSSLLYMIKAIRGMARITMRAIRVRGFICRNYWLSRGETLVCHSVTAW